MPQKSKTTIAVIGIDIGKNSFHFVGHDEQGAIALRQSSAPKPTVTGFVTSRSSSRGFSTRSKEMAITAAGLS
jgi:hypothetical protein